MKPHSFRRDGRIRKQRQTMEAASSSLHVEAVCNWFSRFLERQWSSFMGLCVATLPNSFFYHFNLCWSHKQRSELYLQRTSLCSFQTVFFTARRPLQLHDEITSVLCDGICKCSYFAASWLFFNEIKTCIISAYHTWMMSHVRYTLIMRVLISVYHTWMMSRLWFICACLSCLNSAGVTGS